MYLFAINLYYKFCSFKGTASLCDHSTTLAVASHSSGLNVCSTPLVYKQNSIHFFFDKNDGLKSKDTQATSRMDILEPLLYV